VCSSDLDLKKVISRNYHCHRGSYSGYHAYSLCTSSIAVDGSIFYVPNKHRQGASYLTTFLWITWFVVKELDAAKRYLYGMINDSNHASAIPCHIGPISVPFDNNDVAINDTIKVWIKSDSAGIERTVQRIDSDPAVKTMFRPSPRIHAGGIGCTNSGQGHCSVCGRFVKT